MNDGNAKTAYTMKEAAQQLGIPIGTMRRLVASNQIASTLDPNGKYGPTRMITADALKSYRSGDASSASQAEAPIWVDIKGAKDATIARLTEELAKTRLQLKATKHHVAALQRKAAEREATFRTYEQVMASHDGRLADVAKAQADHIETLKNMLDILGRQITDTNDALAQMRGMMATPQFAAGLKKLVRTLADGEAAAQ